MTKSRSLMHEGPIWGSKMGDGQGAAPQARAWSGGETSRTGPLEIRRRGEASTDLPGSWGRAAFWDLMAEREGFEPSVPLRVLTLSKRTRSAAPAPLHESAGRAF